MKYLTTEDIKHILIGVLILLMAITFSLLGYFMDKEKTKRHAMTQETIRQLGKYPDSDYEIIYHCKENCHFGDEE